MIERRAIDDGVEIVVETFGGDRPGPTLTILGGVHGDELEGRLAAAILARDLGPTIESGTLRIVRTANPLAAVAGARLTPLDGGNLARSFPGDPSGSITERIAAVLTASVIRGSDVLIDLHSAGAALEMPLMVGYAAAQADRCEPLARAFGAPLIWEHNRIGPGRSIGTAADLGVAALYVECAGGRSIRQRDLSAQVDGVVRVASIIGLVSSQDEADPVPARLIRGGDGDLDASLTASCAGWAVTHVSVGQTVEVGDALVDVYDPSGGVREVIQASAPGVVMALRRDAIVEPGDFILMLGADVC